MKTKDLDQAIVIVAGGTGGIGRATCKILAQEGATVVVASRTGKEPSLVYGADHLLIEADLSSPDEWNTVARTVEQRYGRIDVMINCVGTIIPGSITRLSDDDIRQMVDINLMNVVFGIRAVVPGMLQRGYGHIINVGSLGAFIPMPHEALYSATKAAIRALSMSLDQELHRTGIRISMVSPGPVRTKMLDIESYDEYSTMAFVQKVLQPERVAHEILKSIHRPRKEAVIPRVTGMLALAISRLPLLLTTCYPILDAIGRIGLERYRRTRMRYSTTPTGED